MLSARDRASSLPCATCSFTLISCLISLSFQTFRNAAFLFILLLPLIYGTVFAALWSQKTAADEREKNAALEMKSQLAEQNLRQVQRSSEELARLRHDVLGQFTTLENLGRAGEYDRMLSCLAEYTQSARSAKGEGHGWGIKIMQDIALRYGSQFQFENSAGTVSAGAALYMPET